MRSKLTLTITVVLAAMLWLVPAAGAQLELYASNGQGAETGFVQGAANTVSVRGSIDPASGGTTVLVRQIDIFHACPSAQGSEAPVLSEFIFWVGSNAELPKAAVFGGINSAQPSTRFCIYSYWQSTSPGPDNPDTTDVQDVNFRIPTDTLSWFSVASATSPEYPYFALAGSSETASPVMLAFVNQKTSCPANYPGGSNSLVLGTPPAGSFSFDGEARVKAGFWRACSYFQVGVTSLLAGQSEFSRSPRSGWVPRYKFKRGTLRRKKGRWQLGATRCRIETSCRITLEARSGKKLLARGSAKGKAGSKKQVKLTLKPTSAGKKALRRSRSVKVRVTATSVIDLSEVDRRVTVRLR